MRATAESDPREIQYKYHCMHATPKNPSHSIQSHAMPDTLHNNNTHIFSEQWYAPFILLKHEIKHLSD